MPGAAQMVRKVKVNSRMGNLPKGGGDLRNDRPLMPGARLICFRVTRIPLQCTA